MRISCRRSCRRPHKPSLLIAPEELAARAEPCALSACRLHARVRPLARAELNGPPDGDALEQAAVRGRPGDGPQGSNVNSTPHLPLWTSPTYAVDQRAVRSDPHVARSKKHPIAPLTDPHRGQQRCPVDALAWWGVESDGDREALWVVASRTELGREITRGLGDQDQRTRPVRPRGIGPGPRWASR